MGQTEILEELKKLTPMERLAIIESAVHQVRTDLKNVEQPLLRVEEKRQLGLAARALFADYATDSELTIFTALDGEDFHA